MKSNSAILILMLLGLYEQAMALSAEDMAGYKKHQEACIKELSIGDAEAKMITDNHEKDIATPSKEFKCYHSCLYKKLGLIGADGKPLNESILKFVMARFSALPADKVKQTAVSCAAAKGEADCDYIYNFEQCLLKGLKA